MISWSKIIVLLVCSIGLHTAIQAQSVYYYKLIKTKINGVVSIENNGGQFICIYDDLCYDCDINGKGVNNGQLHLKSKDDYIIYYGESYFGKNTYYKFNKNLGILNIITPQGDIYAYKKATPPSNIKTCSFIKSKKNTSSPIYHITAISSTNQQIDNNTPQLNNSNTPRQKTKVRKQCAYCSGKGERIQHEYATNFGTNGPRVYCNICNQSWNYGTIHTHHRCNHCNGTGYIEYEY